ncbi:MAG: hypothetical protein PHI19_03010 [Clostridia bacterium]|nr:hypothetical protein [Clostridia bacterium]
MNKKIFSKKTLFAAMAPVIAFLLIVALVTATALLANTGKVQVKGIIGRGENGEATGVISDAPFQYEAVTRTAFVFDFEKFLAVVFMKDIIDSTNAMGISLAQQWGTIVIDAFRRARVPSEKLLAFGKYLANTADEFSQEVFHEDPEKASLVVVIWALLNEDPQGDLLYQVAGAVDWVALYNEMITETGLNPEEAGRVLYQLALALAEGSDKQLIADLGERSFVVLFSQTMVAATEISMLTSGSTLASARMVAEVLYELGAEYRNIIETFGIENLNNLFGSVYLDELLADTNYSDHVLSAFTESKELFGFAVAFLSEMFTVLDNQIAYSYYNYLHEENSNQAYAECALILAAAIEQGLDYAYGVTGLDEVALGLKIAGINAHLNLVSEPEADYEQKLIEETAEITRAYGKLIQLTELEAEASAAGYEEFLKNPKKVQEIADCAQEVLGYAPNIERGAKTASALILFSYLSYLIVPTE